MQIQMPQLSVELIELREQEQIPHGRFDLTHAAADWLAEGRPSWENEHVPASVEVCKALPHSARMAAWNGTLVSPGLPEAFAAFADACHRAGGPTAVAFRCSVLEDARKVRKHAAWLLDAVTAADALHEKTDACCHPLHGAIVPLQEIEHDIPFAFATVRLQFVGLNPVAYAEFLSAEGCRPEDYLCTCLKQPERWFTDIEELTRASCRFVSSGDFKVLEADLKSWSAGQKIFPVVGDTSRIILRDKATRQDAVMWCSELFRKTEELCKAVAF